MSKLKHQHTLDPHSPEMQRVIEKQLRAVKRKIRRQRRRT